MSWLDSVEPNRSPPAQCSRPPPSASKQRLHFFCGARARRVSEAKARERLWVGVGDGRGQEPRELKAVSRGVAAKHLPQRAPEDGVACLWSAVVDGCSGAGGLEPVDLRLARED